MKQNKTYLHLGVTLIVSACAVLMFYDTFFQSRVLLDFFDKLMQGQNPCMGKDALWGFRPVRGRVQHKEGNK